MTVDDVIERVRERGDDTAFWSSASVRVLIAEIEWMRDRLFELDRDWPYCGRPHQAPPPPSVTFWLGADAP